MPNQESKLILGSCSLYFKVYADGHKGYVNGVPWKTAYQISSQMKFLEMNTDVYIPNISYNSFDFDALETFLTTNSFTKFRVIYKVENTANEFIERLKSICDTNSITFDDVPVAVDAITIPYFEDLETEFTLRISYDITALVDDVYCRDKKELLSLIFDNDETNLIPKTYFQKDSTTYDNVSNLICIASVDSKSINNSR